MARSRFWLSLVLAVVLIGSLAGNLAWAAYLRSSSYRNSCASLLSERLGLPSEIGAVTPRGRRLREFNDVVVWLSERRDQVLTCRTALLRTTPQPDDPEAYELELLDGSAEVSNRTWLGSDYRGVVESGLRSGFAPGGPRRVSFGRMDVGLHRDDFVLSLDDAGGAIEFTPQRATTNAICRSINGVPTVEPVLLFADISPQPGGMRIDELRLQAPRIGLDTLRLGALLGGEVTRGEFAGKLTYREDEAGRTVELEGVLDGVELAELTGRVRPGPWRGRCTAVRLQALRLEERRPTRVEFDGAVSEVMLADVAATFGLAGGPGTAALTVGEAKFGRAGIERFVASGRSLDISLQEWTRGLGFGEAAGRLRVRIDDLTIEGNRLKSLDATLTVDRDSGERWIETRLLREAAARALHITLPSFLPERVQYAEFGVRLEVRDEQLFVFGTHGSDGRAILSTELFGERIAIVSEPKRAFELGPWLDLARARLEAALADDAQ